MNSNITGRPHGRYFGNVVKDVKNTAAGGEDRSEEIIRGPPYNPDTCYPM